MTTATPQMGDLLGKSELIDFGIPEVDQSRPPEIECLCPFCGAFNVGVGKPCGHCALEDTNATRAATTQRLGPWFVLQTRNPAAPGMNFETLQSLIRRRVVTSRSVVRGPTTGQLWRLASKVRGLSREFGQCYDCGEDIESDEAVCPHCERLQTLPDTPEARGEVPESIQSEPTQSEPTQSEPTQSAVLSGTSAEPVVGADDLVNESSFVVGSAPEVVASEAAAASDVDPTDAEQAAERASLIGELEPITVMSSESVDESPVKTVQAEHAPDRHIPKDDLLTARDVAKAFLLEFGPQAVVPPTRAAARARPRDYRKLKTAVSLVAVLVVTAGVWPVGHVVAGWFQSNPAPIVAPQPTPTAPANTTVADARLAGDRMAPSSTPQAVPTPMPADLQPSTGKLDVAIAGEGYFHVKISPTVADGTGYTRDGVFARGSDGDLFVNAGSGYRLIPTINIPVNATDISIAPDGVVQYAIAGTSVKQIAGQVQLAKFKNPAGLSHLTGSIYTETQASGLCWLDIPGTHNTGPLKQGFLNTTAADVDVRPVVVAQAPVQPAVQPSAQSPVQPRVVFQPVVYESRRPVATPASALPAVEDLAPGSSPSDDPKTLLTAGMTAEATGDYAGAVAAYERIESLPSDQWPASLELRLKLARKELKGDLR